MPTKSQCSKDASPVFPASVSAEANDVLEDPLHSPKSSRTIPKPILKHPRALSAPILRG